MKDDILEALAPFRTSLQADGADLLVLQANEQNLKMELIISEETCLDCVVPKSIMENIILTQLEKIGIKFAEFDLKYPQL